MTWEAGSTSRRNRGSDPQAHKHRAKPTRHPVKARDVPFQTPAEESLTVPEGQGSPKPLGDLSNIQESIHFFHFVTWALAGPRDPISWIPELEHNRTVRPAASWVPTQPAFLL